MNADMISGHPVVLSLGVRRHAATGAGGRGDLLLQLRLVGADELVHLLPVLEEEERRGRPDVPRRAELLRDETKKDGGII
jgi:hypothetical protein